MSRLTLSFMHSENFPANLNWYWSFTTQSQWQACSQATYILTASVTLKIEKWSVCGLPFSCLIDWFFFSFLTVAFKPKSVCLKAASYFKISSLQWRKFFCSLDITTQWTALSKIKYVRFWYMMYTSVHDRSMDWGDVYASKRFLSRQTTFIYYRFKIFKATDRLHLTFFL